MQHQRSKDDTYKNKNGGIGPPNNLRIYNYFTTKPMILAIICIFRITFHCSIAETALNFQKFLIFNF